MINEAPMIPGQRRARAAQTKQRFSTARSGQTLQNLRLKQKGSQDAMARARRTSSTAARPVAIDTGPVQTPVVPLSAPRIISRKPKPIKKVKPKVNTLGTPVTTEQASIPSGAYSAQNYKATMKARMNARKKAAASAAQKTKARYVNPAPSGSNPNIPGHTTGGGLTKQQLDNRKKLQNIQKAGAAMRQDKRDKARKDAEDAAEKAAKDAKQKAKDAADARSERRKRNLKRAVVGTGLAGAAASFALASHTEYDKPSIKERKKMKNFHSLREAKMVTGNETGMMFKVSIEGLPDMIMVGRSPSGIKGQLRKIVKQPSMIQSVERMPKSKVKMMYRDIVAGREEEE